MKIIDTTLLDKVCATYKVIVIIFIIVIGVLVVTTEAKFAPRVDFYDVVLPITVMRFLTVLGRGPGNLFERLAVGKRDGIGQLITLRGKIHVVPEAVVTRPGCTDVLQKIVPNEHRVGRDLD